jgi:small ligand-binding sensory domain FIST
MILAGSGITVSQDPVEAAIEAALTAQDRCGVDSADFCFVFMTPPAHAAAAKMLHAILRITGAQAIVGCGGAGVLTERMEVEAAAAPEGAVAVAVLAVKTDEHRASGFLTDETDGLGVPAGTVTAGKAFHTAGNGGITFVLPDPVELEPMGFLQGFREAGGTIPVLGAVAAGTPAFEFCNTQVVSRKAVGLALSAPRPVIGVAQGCEPIGEPFIITRGEDQVVREIAGRPAIEVLREALAGLEDAETRVRAAGIFAGLAMNPAKSPLTRGDFLVRNLLRVDQRTGAVAVAEPVRPGQTIQFQIRDARAAADDLAATLRQMATELEGRRPAFGVYFNCAGRGQGLYGVPDHDIGLIREHLGEFPLAGFFGNGEFAPVGPRNFFHTYTGVLAVFPETGEAQAP